MTDFNGLPNFSDSERPVPSSSDLTEGDEERAPLVVKLSDLWSDYIRGVNAGRNPDASSRSRSSVPILDDMKGILQWE